MKVTAALVSLAYLILMVVQVQHLAQSFFTAPVLAIMMAVAIVVGCSFGYGGVFHLFLVNHRARGLACVPLICFFAGSYMSIMASQTVFEASQQDRQEWRSLGTLGQSTRNELIRAGKAIEQMQSSGVMQGAELEAALQRQKSAMEAHKAQEQSNKESGKDGDDSKELKGMSPLFQAICLEMISHGLGIVLFLMGASQITGRSYDFFTPPKPAASVKKPLGVAA